MKDAGVRRGPRKVAPAREDSALYQQVLENMVEGVSLSTDDGTIVYTNPAEDEMFGYPRGGLLGRHLLAQNGCPSGDADRMVERVFAQLRERGYWEGEFRHLRKDGTPFQTRARIRRLDLDGAPHWVCVQEDITLRKELEDRERENARDLKTLLRVQEDLASNLQLDRVVQVATDAVTLLSRASFGAFFYNAVGPGGESYTRYTLSGAPAEAFSQYPLPRNTAVFGPTFRGERPVRSDDITKDPRYGQNVPHHGMPVGHLPVRSYLAVPVVSRDGTVHGGFFLGHPDPGKFTQDGEDLVVAVAAQTALALENVNLYRRARESEERMRNVLDNAPVQIMSVDEDGRILTLNRSALEDSGAVVGSSVYDLVTVENRERVKSALEEVIRTGTPAEFEVQVNAGADGIRRHQVRVAPLLRDDDRGAILLATDVTERRHHEEELARMRAQLIRGEKLSALGSLVSGVGHELRTPLTFLANNVFLLQHRLEAAARRDGTAKEALETVRPFVNELTAGVDRINQLVEDLRRYTKARQAVESTVAPVHVLIADAVALFRATNRGTNPVETSFSSTRPIQANQGSIQQLALNLLQNAAEASRPGDPVRIVTRQEGGDAVLEVIDHGSGIPEDVRKRMFEPLFTTKAEGTGLGLSIVRRIVEESKASLECESQEGRGTTFRVRFPVHA